ncbi:hypothetical protein PV08_09034 [Exophiala spinifera]|uniref:Clr5 domain-containing protein n=1 Tax=Exophiala spinifera TaxID=91928 RepID=A0A0D1ZFI7_9EURO|nr:uncharacterized protein PV08_09034 [Exophiala spinifera]KIW11762.1 hypothetical protein PV08_09034 [Exophiala spinifera]
MTAVKSIPSEIISTMGRGRPPSGPQHDDWEAKRNIIERLYISEGKSLKTVQAIMLAEHHFSATFVFWISHILTLLNFHSKSQYEMRFNDWGLRKKVKHRDWIDIDCYVQRRKRLGVDSDVYIDGILIPPKKLRKKARRNDTSAVTTFQQEPHSPELPNRVSILTPQPCQLLAPPIEQLPWALFSASLEAQCRSRFGDILYRVLMLLLAYDALLNPQHQSSSAGGHHDQMTNQSLPFASTSYLYSTFFRSLFPFCSGVDTSQQINMISALLPITASLDTPQGQDFCSLTIHNANIQLLMLLTFSLSNNLLTNYDIDLLLKLVPPPSRLSLLRDLVSHKGAATEGVTERLFEYAILCDTQMLSMLLGLGIDPNEQVVSWLGALTTPLAYAANFAKKEAVKVLISEGADVNGTHSFIKDGGRPIEKAVECGAWATAQLLLNHGAKVDGSYRSRTGASMLECAFRDYRAPDPCLIKALLDNGVSMGLDGHQCAKILALALPYSLDTNDVSWQETIHHLLQAGVKAAAEPVSIEASMLDDDGELLCFPTPLSILERAADLGDTNTFLLLHEAGARITRFTLYYAAGNGNEALVKFLLGKGVNPNEQFPSGDCALLVAASSDSPSHKSILRLLVDSGANVNPERPLMNQSPPIWTPLQAASYAGNILEVELLLRHQADIHADAGVQNFDNPALAESFTALSAAAYEGHTGIVRRLLEAGAKVGQPASPLALSAAARSDDRESLGLILEAGADINASMGTYPNPLNTATLLSSRQTVEWLLSHGAKADVTGGNHPSAIQAAIIRSADGFDDLIQSLISAGGDVNAAEGHVGVDENFDYYNDRPKKWHTPLVLAIKQNRPGIVDLLLSKGANANDLSGLSYSTTALEAAASQANLGLVFRLLRAGAETDDPEALLAAVRTRRGQDVAGALLTAHSIRYHGLRKHFGGLALQYTIAHGDLTLMKQLIDAGIDVNAVVRRSDGRRAIVRNWDCSTFEERYEIRDGESPLGTAVRSFLGHTAAVSLLLQHGANPNSFVVGTRVYDDGTRQTVLVAAIATRNEELVKMLVAAGADVNWCLLTDERARTPLQEAAGAGLLSIVRALIEAGARVNNEGASSGGVTALQAAAIGGHVNVARLLIELGAQVDAPRAPTDGRTALEGAAEHGRIDMVQLLLNSGAEIDEYDPEGQYRRALDFSYREGHLATWRLLKRSCEWTDNVNPSTSFAYAAGGANGTSVTNLVNEQEEVPDSAPTVSLFGNQVTLSEPVPVQTQEGLLHEILDGHALGATGVSTAAPEGPWPYLDDQEASSVSLPDPTFPWSADWTNFQDGSFVGDEDRYAFEIGENFMSET